MNRVFIAVIGASNASAEELIIAEEVGKLIARNDAVLVCGGMEGVMEAACRGANSEGGMTIGILPGDTRHGANEFVQIPVVTGIGYARNVVVVKSAHAVIAIGGSYGTLSEIAYALQSGIPVIGLDTWRISRNGNNQDPIARAGNPREAVETALELVT